MKFRKPFAAAIAIFTLILAILLLLRSDNSISPAQLDTTTVDSNPINSEKSEPLGAQQDLPSQTLAGQSEKSSLERGVNRRLILPFVREVDRNAVTGKAFDESILLVRDGPDEGPLTLNQHTMSAVEAEYDPAVIKRFIESDADTIRIPLDAEKTVEIEVEKVISRSSVTHSLIGGVRDNSFSEVTLVFHDGVVSGSIAFLDRNIHYQYGSSGNGNVAIRRLDPSTYTERCGDPGEPEVNLAAANSVTDSSRFQQERVKPSASAMEEFDGEVSDDDSSSAPVESGDALYTMDTVIGYDAGARVAEGSTAAIEALIIASVDRTNTSFTNSGVTDIELVLLATIEDPNYVYPGAVSGNMGSSDELGKLDNTSDGFLDAVTDLRIQMGADHAGFVLGGTDGSAGVAYIGGRSMIVARTYMTSTRLTFPHEFGHNIGCLHAWGDTDWATSGHRYGWRLDPPSSERVRTIMAYDWQWGSGARIQHFSDPTILYNGAKTGAVDGYDASGDTTADPRSVAGGLNGTTQTGYDGSHTSLGARNADYIQANAQFISDNATRVVPVPGPEISVEHPSTNELNDGSSTVDFGYAGSGLNPFRTVAIHNQGADPLTGIAVTIDGAHAGDYSITTAPAPTLSSLRSTYLTIQFNPSALGPRIAKLHIASNDANESPFDVTLKGWSVVPPTYFSDDFDPDTDPSLWAAFGASVAPNTAGQAASSGSTGNSLWFGGSGDRYALTRPIDTSAGGNISFLVAISGATATLWDNVEPGEELYLEYTTDGFNFTQLAGPFTNTTWQQQNISIPVAARTTGTQFRFRQIYHSGNNFDSCAIEDLEVGSPPPSAPDISLEQPTGSPLNDQLSTVGFGPIALGSSQSLQFTVRNDGDLNLSGLGGITIDGTDAADYSLTVSPSASLTPGNSTTFTIQFTPSSEGTRTAVLHIPSNDPDESPFDVFLSGSSTAPGGATYTIDASDRGWYSGHGSHTTSNINFFTGSTSSNTENRSFLTFPLPALAPDETIVSAELRLFNVLGGYSSTDPTETLYIHEVTTDSASLVNGSGGASAFLDLGDGNTFGGPITVSSASDNSTIEIPLSGSFLSMANAEEGNTIAVGGVVRPLSGGGATEGIFSSSHNATLSQTQLVLHTRIGTLEQTIDIPELQPKFTSSAPFSLPANASSGLPITYTVVGGSNVATISGNDVTLTGNPGAVTILASQSGGGSFGPADDVYVTTYVSSAGADISQITLNRHADHILKADGTIWNRGYNNGGELGDGSSLDRREFSQMGTDTDWSAISAGFGHVLALKSNGTLWAWGYNLSGRVGDGTTTTRRTPVQIGSDTNWSKVAAGDDFSYALKTNGTLWSWGDNGLGQLGDGTTTDRFAPAQVGSDTNWLHVACGDRHVIATKTNGTLWSWGTNFNGNLGNGSTTTSSFTPQQIGTATDWGRVFAGAFTSFSIKSSNTLWSWGQGGGGALGTGSESNLLSPQQVNTDTDWSDFSVGFRHINATKTDGTLWVWGSNFYGEQGNATRIHELSPKQFGTRTDHSIVATSMNTTFRSLVALDDNSLLTWGGNSRVKPVGTAKPFPLLSLPDTVEEIAAGTSHSMAVLTDGTLWTWGFNYAGKLGDGTQTNRAEAEQVGSDTNWKQAAAGDFHSLAVKTDGTLWGWGEASLGAIGSGSSLDRSTPTQIGSGTNWDRVAAGDDHSLGRKTDGTLWGWGHNLFGQVGNGSNSNQYNPVQIGTDNDWEDFSAGDRHSLAVKSNGTLWAWGDNNVNQLGDGSTIDKYSPTQIGSATNWLAVAAGDGHSLGLKTDGTLWAWGVNFGRLGDGTSTQRSTPIQIGTDRDWTAIAAAFGNSMALKADGTLWSWADNTQGRVGDGTYQDRLSPVQIGAGTFWSKLPVGGWSKAKVSYAISSEGTLWGWGDDANRLLADASFDVRIPRFDLPIADQSITFPGITLPAVGQSVALSASAESGMPVTYLVSGDATISGNQLTVTGTGPISVHAYQRGDSIWDIAGPVPAPIAGPEITIEQPIGTTLTSGIGSVSFPAATIGQNSVRSFQIRNDGTEVLNGLALSKVGSEASDYTLGSISSTSLSPGQTATFDVIFSPSSGGARHAELHVTSNDLDEDPFQIPLIGEGLAPDITVEEPPGTSLTDGTSETDFNSVLSGQTAQKTYTIRNDGTSALSNLAVTIDGTHAAQFSKTDPVATVLQPGESTSFSVSFAPAGFGVRNAVLHIASDDLDENPFDISLTGVAQAPEIVVEQPVGSGLTDGDGDGVTFGATELGENSQRTFTIRNIGNVPLTGLSASSGGSHSAEFAPGAFGSDTLLAGDSTTVSVTFTPAGLGTRAAALQIASNDSDENPFDIALSGQGITPDISIEHPLNAPLTDGLSAVDFGSKVPGEISALTFTIRNEGTSTLNSFTALVDGVQSTEFSAGSFSTGSLAPNATGTITVTFSPNGAGSRTATLRIGSNDLDENPFDIALTGTGLDPEIVVEEPALTNIQDGTESRDFGPRNLGDTSQKTFTIRNTGTVDLTGLSASFIGAESGDFTPGALGQTSLTPGTSTTLVVTFAPSALGVRNATLQITSNDRDENPFDLAVSGIGAKPEITIEQPLANELNDGGDTVDFDDVIATQQATKTFTIRNTGNGPLTGLALGVDGAQASEYVASNLSATTVEPSETATFTVTFTPSAFGTRAANLHVASNDDDESPFDIALTGEGLDPEIVVEEPINTSLTDGTSTRDIGSANVGVPVERTFTIRNIGTVDLTGLAASFAGDDAPDFSAGTFGQTTLAPGTSTSVAVTFTPSATGARTTTLRIASNDRDENPFDIAVTGTGTAPEISIEQPLAADLTDGGSTIDYGDVTATQQATKTFTIRNTGDGPLTGIALSVDGAQPSEYVASGLSATAVAPNETATFTVTFTPSAFGTRAADLHVSSNDDDESPFDIALTGNGLDPEIEVEQPVNTSLTDAVSTRDMGSTNVGTSIPLAFTIRNIGTVDLTGLNASFAGNEAPDFSAGAFGQTTLAPGASTTVSITLTPSDVGLRSTTLRIASNDRDENPFEIDVSGTGTKPEIVIEQPLATDLTDGGSTINYGDVVATEQATRTFTIRNTGDGPLTGLALSIDGAEASEYVASNLSATTVAPNQTATFTVAFTPTAFGNRGAALHISSNDDDESPFDIALTGNGLDPEIAIEQPFNTSLTDGTSTRDFGSANVTTSVDLTFTIRNIGTVNLTDLAASFVGPNASEFSAAAFSQATLAPGALATVVTTFTPSATGVRSATLRIASNDRDENPFDIDLSGTGTAPEISIEQPLATDLIDSGSTINYGDVNATEQSTRTFTIRNTGDGPLTGLALDVDGSHASEFVASGLSATTVAPNETATFAVAFTPTAFGTRSAAVHLTSNDADESPFDINLTGNGLDPEIVVEEPVDTSLTDGTSTRDFGSTNVDTSVDLTFTIRNIGTTPLTSLAVSFVGPNASDFEGATLAQTTLAPGASTTAVTSFSPSATGLRNATLRIASNDRDENPFDIDVSGTGTKPEIEITEPVNTLLLDGLSTSDFGDVDLPDTASRIFTIRNTGDGPLTDLAVTIDGANQSEFASGNLSATTVLPGDTATFSIAFTPLDRGIKTAALHVASNDENENPYDINLTGTGLDPEIEVEQPTNTSLTDGQDSVGFGFTGIGDSTEQVFTIRNTGNTDLNGLAASFVGDSGDFSAGAFGSTSVAAGESTTVTIIFSPTALGERSADLRIASNDLDENPFNITVSGYGGFPEIAVEQDSSDLTDEVSDVAFADLLSDGSASTSVTLTIRNTGHAPLTGLSASVDGTNASEFTSGTIGSDTLLPGESTTVALTFTPSEIGTRTALLHLASNDEDENPFDLVLRGDLIQRTTLESWADSFGLTGDAALPDADDDGDLITLLEEYAYFLDPTVQDAHVLTPGTGTSGLPSIRLLNGRLQIEFIQRRSDPDLVYDPQFSSDLSDASFSPATIPATIFPIDLSSQRVIVDDSETTADQPSRFGRVRLSFAE